jgi:hypothetical protein
VVLLATGHVAFAQLWTAWAPGGPPTPSDFSTWQAVAISADGTKLAAGGGLYDYVCDTCNIRYGNSLYVSTNSGATWTSGPADFWQSIAASADWTKLVAVSQQAYIFGYVIGTGQLYTSTDSGATWTANTNVAANAWSSVASSADGSQFVAVANLSGDGSIYISTDSGSTWSPVNGPINDWTSVASSADGMKLIAASDTNNSGSGYIFTSSDAGATWNVANLPINNWASVASSADGTQLVAAAWQPAPPYGGAIYRSVDSGASWTLTAAPSDQQWSTVASSADGTILLAGGSSIYMSRDSGGTWTLTAAPPYYLPTIALSPDGSRALAGDYHGLYSLPYSGPWQLDEASTNSWFALASSADGRQVVAATGQPYRIYQSTNSGAAWSETSASHSGPLASSADGSKLFTAAGQLYASSNSGVTWLPILATSKPWSSITSSGDGRVLLSAWANPNSYNGQPFGGLYLSTNGGGSWAQSGLADAMNDEFVGVACSADGVRLVAVSGIFPSPDGVSYNGDGYIYTSSDSGRTWNWSDAPPNAWTCVASSADGVKLVAGSGKTNPDNPGDGYLYTSANSGALWRRTRSPKNGWSSVASSADGTRLVATTLFGDAIYLSSDSGTNWVSANAPAGNWTAVTLSADGETIVAVGGNGSICTLRLQATTLPALSIGLSGGNVGLSWLVLSTGFVLQQSADLGSTNWLDVTNRPSLDLSSLRDRITLPASPGTAFYRLKQQ